MRTLSRPMFVPSVVGAGTGIGAVAALAVAWYFTARAWPDSLGGAQVALAAFLLLATLLGGHFPIHIRTRTKVYMESVWLYLMAALLVPALAGLVAAGAILLINVLNRKRTGLRAPHIATDVGRRTLVVLGASLVAHVAVSARIDIVPVLAAALVMMAGDLLTAPLLFTPATGEPPLRVVVALFRAGGAIEAAQYLIGVLGVLVARQSDWGLVLLGLPVALVYMAFKRSKEMQDSTRSILESMADTVDLRDPYTGGHSHRVADLVRSTLKVMHRSGVEVEMIISAARVHDIGKIGIPDSVLNKQQELSEEERQLMETHAERGADLLVRYPDFSQGTEIVRHHHEAWDGSGYPHRLRGHEIPFGARVVAVADSFDAMTTDRPYHRAFSVEHAAAILRDGRGQQWDPQVVDAFLRVLAQRYGDEAVTPRLRVMEEPEPHSPAVIA